MPTTLNVSERPIQIPADGFMLDAELGVPEHALGVAVFAHGSGSSRHSARNRAVARVLHRVGARHGAHGSADAGRGAPGRAHATCASTSRCWPAAWSSRLTGC